MLDLPKVSPRAIEERTQRLGREMFERMRGNQPRPHQFAWWQERLLRLCMQDEWFKVQAFRFIDVLPMMHSHGDIARHLREYFVRREPPGNGNHGRGNDANHLHAGHEPGGPPGDGHRRHATEDRSLPRAAREEDNLAVSTFRPLDGPDPRFDVSLRELDPQPFIRELVGWVSWWMNFRHLDSLPATLAARFASFASKAMAGTFIAGATIDEAERAIRRLRAQKLAFTIDVLGEAALSTAEGEAYQQVYLHLIDQLPPLAAAWPHVPLADAADGEPVPRVNVSVKLTSLYPGFDPIAPDACKRRAKELLRPLLRRAMQHGAHLHIDMEHYAIKDLTLDLCEELFLEDEFRDYPHFGIVLQAYLRDGDRDAARTIAYARRRGTPLWVRLVKGAYWDSETVWAAQRRWPVPVWLEKWQSDACYERMTRALLANWQHVRGAFASHNVRSLCHAVAVRQELGVPGYAFELQMLYGMGDPIKHAAVAMGQRSRVYTPYGNMLAGMAYLIRRLLENTANESFLRQSSSDEADEERLLAAPGMQIAEITHIADTAQNSDPSRQPSRPEPIRARQETAATNAPDLRETAATALPYGDEDKAHRFTEPSVPQLLPAGRGSVCADGRGVVGPGPVPPRSRTLFYEFEEPVMEPFDNAPNADFALPDVRRQMQAGLAQARAAFGREYPLLIAGRPVTTGQWFESHNPSRPSEVVGRIAQATESSVDQAVRAAAEAFQGWRHAPAGERADLLRRVAALLEQRRFSLAGLMVYEVGKTWREADADVSEAIDYCAYYAAESDRIARHPRRRDIDGETNEYFYVPRGITAVLSPWNFPLCLLANMTAAAVVTGNTTVIKPASQAAAIAARLVEAFVDAGAPTGVVNYLPGPGAAVGEALVRHPDVATIAFTGSTAVGQRINRLAAEHPARRPAIKRAILDLGAKNAILVDSDADLDEAIKGVVASAFSYAGQKCSAASRVIVLESIHERFVERLVEAVRSKTVGPADEPTTAIPPVIDAAALAAIRQYIDLGHREGRCVLSVNTDAQASESGGFYIGPHIFDGVSPDARIAREEIFGPVLAVIRAHSLDEAITIFNRSDYALTGGVFSRSPGTLERVRAECECGNLYINRPITGSRVDLQPYGGFKLSGSGSKSGGPDYLLQFCEARTVTENTLRRGFAPSEEVVEALG